MDNLATKHCQACEGGIPELEKSDIDQYLQHVPEWNLVSDHKEIHRIFEFKNYFRTMAFVNAVAWMAHQENHHPDLEVSYNRCVVRYSTHAVNGLTENDFICAAKIDQLL